MTARPATGPRDQLAGRLVLRGEPGYERARVGRVFNARRPDRYPAAVLLAADDDDVIAGVRLAAEQGWTVSVRSGGHSWAVWSLRDDALLIDLGGMRDMAYDPATGVVSARPAVQGGLELAPFLAERGRAFPGGHCATVGLGGFLLQGGQGWDSRARGWACQSVVGLDVVTADGRLVRADAGQNPDLLWAARGAGPGFPGVITRFRLQTYPAPRAMWHDTWTFRLDDAVELLGWLHDVLPGLDRRVEPVVAATRLPDVPLHDGAARPDGTVLLLHTTVMADSDAEALGLLAPLQDGPLAGRELGHVRGPTSVLEENAAQTAQNPEGHRYAVDCTWTDAPAAVLAPMLQRCGASWTPSTRSPSGTGGRPGTPGPTWRSRWRPTCTWRRTRSTPTRPTTRGTPAGCTAGRPNWPPPAAPASTWATPTSPGGRTGSCPTTRTAAWPRSAPNATRTAASPPT